MDISYLAYALMFGVTLYFWYLEKKDISCPTFQSSSAECKRHGGMSFSFTNPEDGDSCDDIMNKIRKALGAEQASIKWRRSFTMAVAIMALAFVLVITPGKLPDWKVFYLSVLICYSVMFYNFNYYSYHVFGVAEEWGKRNIDKLYEKRCLIRD